MIDRYVSPAELRRLLAGLSGVIGVILIFGLFALIVVPGLRNANQPPAQTPLERVGGSSGWLDPTEYPPERGYAIPALDPASVMDPTPEQLGRGKALFGQYCVPCHGEDGRGDGPAAGSLKPAPRNFTRPEGWTNGPGRPAVFGTLARGVPGSAMVSYDFLTKRDRMALVHYVRSVARFREPAETAEALAALAKELAAPGGRVPNRIPVSMAEEKLVAEYRSPAALAIGGMGTARLRAVVADGARAARVLAEDAGWRRSPEALAQVVLADPTANGFRPAAAALTRGEWVELLAELQSGTREASAAGAGEGRAKR
jgi:mono/diheme cytochrome c family protein